MQLLFLDMKVQIISTEFYEQIISSVPNYIKFHFLEEVFRFSNEINDPDTLFVVAINNRLEFCRREIVEITRSCNWHRMIIVFFEHKKDCELQLFSDFFALNFPNKNICYVNLPEDLVYDDPNDAVRIFCGNLGGCYEEMINEEKKDAEEMKEQG